MCSRGGFAHVLKNEDLSANQYNVLRILRGAPEVACGEIGNRMITRDPTLRVCSTAWRSGTDFALPRNQGPAHGADPDHAEGLKLLARAG